MFAARTFNKSNNDIKHLDDYKVENLFSKAAKLSNGELLRHEICTVFHLEFLG